MEPQKTLVRFLEDCFKANNWEYVLLFYWLAVMRRNANGNWYYDFINTIPKRIRETVSFYGIKKKGPQMESLAQELILTHGLEIGTETIRPLSKILGLH